MSSVLQCHMQRFNLNLCADLVSVYLSLSLPPLTHTTIFHLVSLTIASHRIIFCGTLITQRRDGSESWVGNHTPNRLNCICLLCSCWCSVIYLFAYLCGALFCQLPWRQTVHTPTSDTIPTSTQTQTVLCHLLHSFIYNLITAGVGIASLLMDGWLDDWMDGWMDDWMDGWLHEQMVCWADAALGHLVIVKLYARLVASFMGR